MKVRMYNKETTENEYYDVNEIHFGKNDTVLECKDGQLLLFENDEWQSFIIA